LHTNTPTLLGIAMSETKSTEISLHSFRTFTVKLPFIGVQVGSAAMTISHLLAALLYPWVMYQISGSVIWMTAIAAVNVSLLLIGLAVGGYLVDFIGFRDIALSASNLAALTGLAVTSLYAADLLTPELFLSLAAIGAILGGPSTVALETRMPDIARFSKVPPRQADTINDVLDFTVLVGAPAVANYLLTSIGVLGLMWAITALSVIALPLLALCIPHFRLGETPRVQDTFESFKFLQETSGQQHARLGGSFVLGFFITMQLFLVPAALAINEMPTDMLGFFLSGAAAGMIVLNVATSSQRRADNDVTSEALLGLAASVALLAFNLSPLMLLAAGVIAGFSTGLLSPMYSSMLGIRAPRHLRSPALGLTYAALVVFLPGEMLAVGILIYAASLQTALIISAVVLLVAALAWHCWFVD
jgi:MFS family permease